MASIGVDIGERFIKFMKAARKGKKLAVFNWKVISSPDFIFKKIGLNCELNDTDTLRLILKKHILEMKPFDSSVYVTLSNKPIHLEVIALPQEHEKTENLKELLEFRLKTVIENLPPAYKIAYQKVAQTGEVSYYLVEIISYKIYEKLKNVFSDLGLKLELLDSNATASLDICLYLNSGKSLCFIYTSYTKSILFFVSETQVKMNFIPVTFKDIVEAFAPESSKEKIEIENMLTTKMLFPETNEELHTLEEKLILFESVRGVFSRFIKPIEKFLKANIHLPEALYITGPFVTIKGFDKFLQSELEIPVLTFTPDFLIPSTSKLPETEVFLSLIDIVSRGCKVL